MAGLKTFLLLLLNIGFLNSSLAGTLNAENRASTMHHSLPEAVYSIEDDPRAAGWPSEIPETILMSDLARLLSIRLPLMRVVVYADLADPEDITTVDFLMLQPTPIDVHVVPIARGESRASRLLTSCFGTIFETAEDRDRFGDFVRVLGDFARVRTEGPYINVRAEEAMMACRVFTKDLREVEVLISEIDNSDGFEGMPQRAQTYEMQPGTVYVDDLRINNATIETVYAQLVKSQRELFAPFPQEEL